MPVEETVAVKAEQGIAAERVITGSVYTSEPEQALQEPNEAIGDRAEHDSSQEMAKDRSGTTSGLSEDVIELAEPRSQDVPEKENPMTQEHTDIAPVSEPNLAADAPLQLPSLLCVTAGGRTPDVLDIVFDVNEALASATRKWSAGQAAHEYVTSSCHSYVLLISPMIYTVRPQATQPYIYFACQQQRWLQHTRE